MQFAFQILQALRYDHCISHTKLQTSTVHLLIRDMSHCMAEDLACTEQQRCLCLSQLQLVCVMLKDKIHDKMVDTHNAVQLLSVDTIIECKGQGVSHSADELSAAVSLTAYLVVQDGAGLRAASKGKYQYDLTDTFLLRGTTERMERYNRCEHRQALYRQHLYTSCQDTWNAQPVKCSAWVFAHEQRMQQECTAVTHLQCALL